MSPGALQITPVIGFRLAYTYMYAQSPLPGGAFQQGAILQMITMLSKLQ